MLVQDMMSSTLFHFSFKNQKDGVEANQNHAVSKFSILVDSDSRSVMMKMALKKKTKRVDAK